MPLNKQKISGFLMVPNNLLQDPLILDLEDSKIPDAFGLFIKTALLLNTQKEEGLEGCYQYTERTSAHLAKLFYTDKEIIDDFLNFCKEIGLLEIFVLDSETQFFFFPYVRERVLYEKGRIEQRRINGAKGGLQAANNRKAVPVSSFNEGSKIFQDQQTSGNEESWPPTLEDLLKMNEKEQYPEQFICDFWNFENKHQWERVTAKTLTQEKITFFREWAKQHQASLNS